MWYEPRQLCDLVVRSRADGTRLHVNSRLVAIFCGTLRDVILDDDFEGTKEVALEERGEALQRDLFDKVAWPSWR